MRRFQKKFLQSTLIDCDSDWKTKDSLNTSKTTEKTNQILDYHS